MLLPPTFFFKIIRISTPLYIYPCNSCILWRWLRAYFVVELSLLPLRLFFLCVSVLRGMNMVEE